MTFLSFLSRFCASTNCYKLSGLALPQRIFSTSGSAEPSYGALPYPSFPVLPCAHRPYNRPQLTVGTFPLHVSEAIRKVNIALTCGSHECYLVFTEVTPMATTTRKPYLTDLTDEQW